MGQVADDGGLRIAEKREDLQRRIIEELEDLLCLLARGLFSEAMVALVVEKVCQLFSGDALEMGWCGVGGPEVKGGDAVDLAEEGSVGRILVCQVAM